MTHRAVVANNQLYTVACDDPYPIAERLWSVAQGRLIDELTGAAVEASYTVELDERRIGINYGDDGAFCLHARPWLRFPPLSAPSYSLHALIRPAGYAPVDLAVNVPTHQRVIIAPAPAAGAVTLSLNDTTHLEAGQMILIGPAAAPAERRRVLNVGPAPQITLDSGLAKARAVGDPVVADEWQPVDLGVIGLRREAVTIRGRAVRRDAATLTSVPVANAVITVTDFWMTLAAVRAQQPGLMTEPNPALRAFALSISPGQYAQRPAPAGQLATIALASPTGDDRLLLSRAEAGSTTLSISDRQLFAPGTFLRFDPDVPECAEVIRVMNVATGPLNEPGLVTLAAPLRCSHRAGARIVPLPLPAPAGAPASFRQAAAAGDRCVFLDSIAGLVPGAEVQISGGPAVPEYQRVTPIEVQSDSDGFFTFPAIQRIAALQLHATATALAPLDFNFHLDYAARENELLVVFT
jgi:hypothetical protein